VTESKFFLLKKAKDYQKVMCLRLNLYFKNTPKNAKRSKMRSKRG